jgi:hypothetical protein
VCFESLGVPFAVNRDSCAREFRLYVDNFTKIVPLAKFSHLSTSVILSWRELPDLAIAVSRVPTIACLELLNVCMPHASNAGLATHSTCSKL